MNEPPLAGSAVLAASAAGGLAAAVALTSRIGLGGLRARRLLRRIDGLKNRIQRLQKFEQLAGIGEYVWNVDAGTLWWSGCSYAIYGLDPAEGIDIERATAAVHPEDLPGVRASVTDLLEGRRPPEIPYRVIRRDGSIRHVISTGELSVVDGRRRVLGVMKDVTELDLAQTRLREAEAQYRYLFDHNPVPMWVVDPAAKRLLAANEAAEQHFGYAAGELAGQPLSCLMPADARAPRSGTGAAHPWRQGEVMGCLHRDGSAMRMALFVHEIRFAGRAAQLIAGQNVTEREFNEERFSLIARATSDAVYDFDLQTGEIWWSESFYVLFGHAPGSVELSIAGWASLIHPEDLDRVNASLEAALASTAGEWRETYRLQRSDGRYALVSERGRIARGPKGQALRMVGGIVDETERRQQEAALRLLRRAVESTDNGVLIADARRRDLPIVYVNPGFERLTGYSCDEIQGRNCRVLQRDDRDQPGIEAIRHALREAHEVRTLLRNYRKDGTLFWNEITIAPVRDERGALTHFVGILNDVSERHSFEEQLAHRATHDELTGLPNRILLEDRLQQALHTSDRYGTGTAVVFIDLDGFKLVNDGLGHDMGDRLLQEVATRLQSAVRETDTVSRFGGDEFVAVLSAPHRDDRPSEIIDRILATLAAPVQLGDTRHTITASVGYCCYPAHGTEPQTLLRHADLAMYQAKLSGRNRAVEYRAEFNANAAQRLQLIAHLREALDRDEFTVLFQPQYGDGGRIFGLEALVRWQHPARGLLAPAEFIGACEDSGLIVRLGRHVLHEAARHHARLVEAGLPGMHISVNVSAAQFNDDLYTDVEHVVRTLGLPAGALELELTESVVMRSPERAIDLMRRLAALGVGFSIDDFGTGYSSLAYLKRFPIARLKIDRSFVQDLDFNAQDAAICDSIIGLAKSLEIGTVAEGVETVQQERWLRDHGCNVLQGFLLGRPQPFDDLLPGLVAAEAAEVPPR
jgi:diguanylate cyclase (GGDEF)-like protein/PAS domain S-box-containing protein